MVRRVRGILFRDYVRMLRGHKGARWANYLLPQDIDLMGRKIDVDAWYPMETFERYGVAILSEIGHGQLEAARMWGRFQVDPVRAAYPMLFAAADAREAMMRFQTLRRTFFDYDALNVAEVDDSSAIVKIAFGMGRVAEEGASHQTLGFFERLVESVGAADVYARLEDRSWEGRPATRLALDWR